MAREESDHFAHNPPKTVKQGGRMYTLVSAVRFNYTHGRKLAREMTEREGPSYLLIEVPDKTIPFGISYCIYHRKVAKKDWAKEIDNWDGYETGYEDTAIKSAARVTELKRKREVLSQMMEKAIKDRRSVSVMKKIAYPGFRVCLEEIRSASTCTDALLRDRLLRASAKGKLGLVTKDELVSNLRKTLKRFGDDTAKIRDEIEGTASGIDAKKDFVELFDRVNTFLSKYEVEIALLFED